MAKKNSTLFSASDTRTSIHIYDVPKDLTSSIQALFNAAGARLDEFWTKNINNYFNRTEGYNVKFTEKDEMILRPVSPTTRPHLLAGAMRYRVSDSGFHIWMDEILNKGVDYGKFLKYGTPDSPGRYIFSLDRRMKGGVGVRKGTTTEQWDAWERVFKAEADKEIDEITKQIGPIVVSDLQRRAYKPGARKNITSHMSGRLIRDRPIIGEDEEEEF